MDALHQFGVELVAVDAEQDQLGLGGAGLAEQVEPGAVAIIDLGAEAAGDVDHLDVGVDQGDRDALGDQHLRRPSGRTGRSRR